MGEASTQELHGLCVVCTVTSRTLPRNLLIFESDILQARDSTHFCDAARRLDKLLRLRINPSPLSERGVGPNGGFPIKVATIIFETPGQHLENPSVSLCCRGVCADQAWQGRPSIVSARQPGRRCRSPHGAQPTARCPRRAAHGALPTARCPRRAAHGALPTARCPGALPRASGV